MDFDKLQTSSVERFPAWATRRYDGWVYVGWIARERIPEIKMTFWEQVEHSMRIDHGEERMAEVYAEGAVCYMREVSNG